MPHDSIELLRRIAGGDRDAFVTFYDAHAPLAFGLIRRILRNAAEAEEVFQERFWEIWQSPAERQRLGVAPTPGRGDARVARATEQAAWRDGTPPVSPTHERFGELAAGYALGALDGDDLTRFEAHLARGCTECEHALAECRE